MNINFRAYVRGATNVLVVAAQPLCRRRGVPLHQLACVRVRSHLTCHIFFYMTPIGAQNYRWQQCGRSTCHSDHKPIRRLAYNVVPALERLQAGAPSAHGMQPSPHLLLLSYCNRHIRAMSLPPTVPYLFDSGCSGHSCCRCRTRIVEAW